MLVSLDYLYHNDDDGYYSLSNISKGKYTYTFDVATKSGPLCSNDADYEILVSANNERKAIKKLDKAIDSGLFDKIEKMTGQEIQQAVDFYG